jgi:hypothetical protein
VAELATLDTPNVALVIALAVALLSAISATLAGDSKEERDWLELAAKWSVQSAAWNGVYTDYQAGSNLTLAALQKLRTDQTHLVAFDGSYPRRPRAIRHFQKQLLRAHDTEAQA